MKKNLLIALIAAASVSALCGFDSAETADSVYEKANAASMEMAGAKAQVTMNVDATVVIADESTSSDIGVLLTGAFDSDIAIDPMAMSMKGSIDMSFMGTSETIEEEMYMVTAEDGTTKSYVYTKDNTSEDGEWAVAATPALDMAAIMEASSNIKLSDLADWGVTFELASEPADIDGTECYLLTTTITGDTFGTILSKASEMTGEDISSIEGIDMALAVVNGLQINVAYCIDTETFLPVGAHIDMDGSDVSSINEMLNAFMGGEEGTTAELVLNDVSMDVMTAYGDAPVIEVPAAALEAEANGEAVSVEDIAEEIAG